MAGLSDPYCGLISDRMNDYLLTMHITVAEMSRRTGMKRSALYAYKRGDATPSFPQLVELVSATGISADWWCGTERGGWHEPLR